MFHFQSLYHKMEEKLGVIFWPLSEQNIWMVSSKFCKATLGYNKNSKQLF